MILFISLIGSLVLWQIGLFLLSRSSDRLDKKGKKLAGLTVRGFGRSLFLFCFVLGLRIVILHLSINESIASVLQTSIAILLVFAVGRLGYVLVDVVDGRMRELATDFFLVFLP
jgi:uncharacterized Tic20 family protein